MISKEKFFPLRVPSGLPSSSSPSGAAGGGRGQGGGGGHIANGGSSTGLAGGGRGAGSVSDDRMDESGHPEGPNIGFGSDPSWLAKARRRLMMRVVLT